MVMMAEPGSENATGKPELRAITISRNSKAKNTSSIEFLLDIQLHETGLCSDKLSRSGSLHKSAALFIR